MFKDYVKTRQRVGEEFTRKRQRLVHCNEQAVVKERLVMMSVFVNFAQILLRLFVEGFLATE